MFNHVLAQTNPPTVNLVQAIESTPILPGLTVNNIFVWSLGAGAILALAIIIWGGILYITSAGNPSKAQEALAVIWAALSGLALLGMGYLILYTINPSILNL